MLLLGFVLFFITFFGTRALLKVRMRPFVSPCRSPPAVECPSSFCHANAVAPFLPAMLQQQRISETSEAGLRNRVFQLMFILGFFGQAGPRRSHIERALVQWQCWIFVASWTGVIKCAFRRTPPDSHAPVDSHDSAK